ncbi:actin-binding LIM protein 1-like [Limulus polyphemus]|uniref:Actin-binding LIM protein 1-like n=1 Tax=Limulus polyphemus TaxID=6850 RepID=A0ABM1TCE2_LIMPO|nr:actin-binding LIM protein 1-like [Limulus polyphemus]
MGKINCEACKKKCSGNALRVQDKYFHEDCFKCKVCSTSLASGGFFVKDDTYYCTKDYHKNFGTKCAACGDYVEGEVVSALGNTYHQNCFICGRCRQPFPTGEKVTFTGKEYLCTKCLQIPEVMTQAHDDGIQEEQQEEGIESSVESGQTCAGCDQELKEGQALIALEKPWHVWCFKCTTCGTVLHGEYMGKDGLPYCEKHYQKLFGVKCMQCDFYVTGKVLQLRFCGSERKRRWSSSSKEIVIDETDFEDEVEEDPRLKKEEEELSKIASGIGKVFLKTVQEREKIRAWKKSHIDPRNASRVPSATHEVPVKLRYDSPVNASPSRATDRPRPWEEDEFDRGSSNRSSLGKSGRTTPTYNVVSSLRAVPKPGYGFATKSATLPVGGRDYVAGDFSFGKLMNMENTDFSSARSDVSGISGQDQQEVNHSAVGGFRNTPISDVYGGFRYTSYSPHFRRSMPNVTFHLSNEPPKLYPYHLLMITNYRLPPDVDRCHLERHLSNQEFQQIFHMSRMQFYRMSEWRRNDLKRRAKLF